MAILKSGILGGVSKRIGSVVGYRLNGQDVIRTLPAQYNDLKSLSQQKQRKNISFLVEQYKRLSDKLRPMFPNRKQTSSAYNQFVSANKKAVIVNDNLEKSINTDNFITSQGDLSTVTFGVLVEDVSGQLTLNWTDNTDNVNSFQGDAIKILMFNANGYKYEPNAYEVAERQDETCVIDRNGTDDYVLYVSFLAANGRVSDSHVIRTVGAGQVISVIE